MFTLTIAEPWLPQWFILPFVPPMVGIVFGIILCANRHVDKHGTISKRLDNALLAVIMAFAMITAFGLVWGAVGYDAAMLHSISSHIRDLGFTHVTLDQGLVTAFRGGLIHTMMLEPTGPSTFTLDTIMSGEPYFP